MTIIDPFEKYSDVYEEVSRNEIEITKFFSNIINTYKIESVLDCACGTGSDLVILSSLCSHVSGSDISDTMLLKAHEKLSKNNLDIPLAKVDFRFLSQHYDHSFDAVFCLKTSIPQLKNKTEIKKALHSMKDVLNPNGILVISQGLTDKQFNAQERFIPVKNTRDHTRIMVIDYLDSEWHIHILDSFHSEGKSSFQTHSFQYITLLEDDYVKLLKETGFRKIQVFGNYNLDEYKKLQSNSMIIIAQL